jgi:hypothetical protein
MIEEKPVLQREKYTFVIFGCYSSFSLSIEHLMAPYMSVCHAFYHTVTITSGHTVATMTLGHTVAMITLVKHCFSNDLGLHFCIYYSLGCLVNVITCDEKQRTSIEFSFTPNNTLFHSCYELT